MCLYERGLAFIEIITDSFYDRYHDISEANDDSITEVLMFVQHLIDIKHMCIKYKKMYYLCCIDEISYPLHF